MPGARQEANPFEPMHWVPLFRQHTPRTKFVSLPTTFLAPLLEGSATTTTLDTQREIIWSDGTIETFEPAPEHSTRSTQSVKGAIADAIAELEGIVTPKFGTKAPIDATWANFHRSIRCENVADILTLLQSSERVLSHLSPPKPSTLALRKWADIDESREYRVFIRYETTIAISQRQPEIHAEYTESQMDDIVNVTTAMYDTTVRGMFPATSYVLDTYIDRRNRVWIIDFAPWGETEGILFDWEELGQAPWMSSSGRAQFRCALRDGVRPSARMFDGLPLELRNVSAMEDLVTAARRMGDAQQTDSSSEDDTVDSDA